VLGTVGTDATDPSADAGAGVVRGSKGVDGGAVTLVGQHPR
jgi:hypothetical protein